MANELELRQNGVGGLVEDNPLTAAATTLTSAALAAMDAVTSTSFMWGIIDPDGIDGAPEHIKVTAHTAGATTATILRGQNGTTARQHAASTPWIHGPVAADFLALIARQGGSATDWTATGTATQPLGRVGMQMGRVDSGNITNGATVTVVVTFPTPFAQIPLTLVSFGNPTADARQIVRADPVSASVVNVIITNLGTATVTCKVVWLAIGEVV